MPFLEKVQYLRPGRSDKLPLPLVAVLAFSTEKLVETAYT